MVGHGLATVKQRFTSRQGAAGTGVAACLSHFSEPASSVSSYLERFETVHRSSADDGARRVQPSIRKLTAQEAERFALARDGHSTRRSLDDGEPVEVASPAPKDDMGPSDDEWVMGKIFSASTAASGAKPLQPLNHRIDGWPRPSAERPKLRLVDDHLARLVPISRDNGVPNVSLDDGEGRGMPPGARVGGYVALGLPPPPPPSDPALGLHAAFRWVPGGGLECAYPRGEAAIVGHQTLHPGDCDLVARGPYAEPSAYDRAPVAAGLSIDRSRAPQPTSSHVTMLLLGDDTNPDTKLRRQVYTRDV